MSIRFTIDELQRKREASGLGMLSLGLYGNGDLVSSTPIPGTRMGGMPDPAYGGYLLGEGMTREAAMYLGALHNHFPALVEALAAIPDPEPGPWTCPQCDQENSGWATACGRCESGRPTAKPEHQDAELALGRLAQIREATGIPYEVEPDLVGVVKHLSARAEAAEEKASRLQADLVRAREDAENLRISRDGYAEMRDQARARAEAAETRVAEAGAHIVASDATIARINAQLSEALERAEKAEQEHSLCMGLLAATTKEAAALRVELAQAQNHVVSWPEAEQKGALAERERICRLFTRDPFQIRIHCPCSTESTSLTYETALRHAEPPVQP